MRLHCLPSFPRLQRALLPKCVPTLYPFPHYIYKMPALFEPTKITLFTKIPSKNALHSLLQRQCISLLTSTFQSPKITRLPRVSLPRSSYQDFNYKLTTGVATRSSYQDSTRQCATVTYTSNDFHCPVYYGRRFP